jgi:hypothetical protein
MMSLISYQVKHQEDERLAAELEAKKARAAEVLQAQLAHAVSRFELPCVADLIMSHRKSAKPRFLNCARKPELPRPSPLREIPTPLPALVILCPTALEVRWKQEDNSDCMKVMATRNV